MKTRRKTLIIIGAVIALLGATAASFAATSATNGVAISPPTGSAATNGRIAKTTALNGTITRPVGKKAQVAGVQLFKIELADASMSDSINIELAWMDPQNAGKVLNNPNSYIIVQAYYPSTSCDVSMQRTVDDGGSVTVCPVAASTDFEAAYLTKRSAVRWLKPETDGQSTLYLLGSIVTPGGVPPGQQSELDSLDIYANVVRR